MYVTCVLCEGRRYIGYINSVLIMISANIILVIMGCTVILCMVCFLQCARLTDSLTLSLCMSVVLFGGRDRGGKGEEVRV